MNQKMKSVSLASLMVLSVLSSLMIASVTVSASTVVITEAVQIVDGGTASDSQAAVTADSSGNVHVVWTRNNLHLYYSMIFTPWRNPHRCYADHQLRTSQDLAPRHRCR